MNEENELEPEQPEPIFCSDCGQEKEDEHWCRWCNKETGIGETS